MPASGRLGRSDTLKPHSYFPAQKAGFLGEAWKVSDRGSLNKGTRHGGQQRHYGSTTGEEDRDKAWRGIGGDRCRDRRDPVAIRDLAPAAAEIGIRICPCPITCPRQPGETARLNRSEHFSGRVPGAVRAVRLLAGCTRNIEFSTEVLILPQRQTVLVAKRATCLAVSCGGRSSIGAGSAGPRSTSSALPRISTTVDAAPMSRSRS